MVNECGENTTKEQLSEFIWKTLNSGKVLSTLTRSIDESLFYWKSTFVAFEVIDY